MENEFEIMVRGILNDVAGMLVAKNADYGDAAMDFGHLGNMISIWHKAKRYRTLVENKQSPNFESIDDTLRDIIGYAVIGLIISKNEQREQRTTTKRLVSDTEEAVR